MIVTSTGIVNGIIEDKYGKHGSQFNENPSRWFWRIRTRSRLQAAFHGFTGQRQTLRVMSFWKTRARPPHILSRVRTAV